MNNIMVYITALFLPIFIYLLMYSFFNKLKKNGIKDLSGFEISRRILDGNSLNSIYIVEVKGLLNDHYDANQKAVRLSTDVFHGENIAAYSVAAFISSYALLDRQNEVFLRIKKMLDPIASLLMYLSYICLILSIFISELFGIAFSFLLLVLLYEFLMIPLNLKARAVTLAEMLKDSNLKQYESDINKILNIYILSSIASLVFDLIALVDKLIKRDK